MLKTVDSEVTSGSDEAKKYTYIRYSNESRQQKWYNIMLPSMWGGVHNCFTGFFIAYGHNNHCKFMSLQLWLDKPLTYIVIGAKTHFPHLSKLISNSSILIDFIIVPIINYVRVCHIMTATSNVIVNKARRCITLYAVLLLNRKT